MVHFLVMGVRRREFCFVGGAERLQVSFDGLRTTSSESLPLSVAMVISLTSIVVMTRTFSAQQAAPRRGRRRTAQLCELADAVRAQQL